MGQLLIEMQPLDFLSAALGQRPRNYSSCCCSFQFVSFPLWKIWKWKNSSKLGIQPEFFNHWILHSSNWAIKTLLLNTRKIICFNIIISKNTLQTFDQSWLWFWVRNTHALKMSLHRKWPSSKGRTSSCSSWCNSCLQSCSRRRSAESTTQTRPSVVSK